MQPPASEPGARHDADEQGGAAADQMQPRPDAAETQLRTFLIADIRGYTAYTREKGDEAAGELAARFAGIVRELVAARAGFLLELRGDEALVVFVSARESLRAAVELQDRFRRAELPRGVGIGLDAGEAVPVEGGYRGSALNVAARLCSQAGPGEIIASEAVVHLAARVEGLAYVEPRSYRLKGLADPVRAVGVVAEGTGPRRLRRTVRRAQRVLPLDRPWLVAAAAVFVLAIGGLVIWGATGRLGVAAPSALPGAGSEAPAASVAALSAETLPTLAFLDSSTGELIDTVSIRNPAEVRFIDGSFWVGGFDPKALYRIDPETHEIVQTITIPLPKEGAFAIDGNILWFSDFGTPGRVIGIDMRTQTVAHDFAVNEDPDDPALATGVAVGAGSLWVARPEASEIVRLDPATGEVQARIEIFAADVLAFGDGALWTTTAAGHIARIDPATNRPAFEPKELASGRHLPYIAFGADHVWTADEEQGITWKVDRTGSVAGTYETGAGARALSFADGVVWVGNSDAGSISGIDALTGEIATYETGHMPGSIAAGDGQLAVALSPGLDNLLATLEGEVLKIAMPGDLSPPDPPVNPSFEFRQIEFATCASLLAYPDEPAPGGWELGPEVAEAVPEVSADGLTYTFRIRDDFRFSPPSDEPVTAETFRYSIERALSPGLGRGATELGMRFLGDIAGAGAFHAGETDHIAGLTAEGNTLTIRLEAPSADLSARLALPYFCPVPLDTPIALDGLDPQPPIASAGPYYLAEHLGPELAVLRPNPNYGGGRPQNFDHIVFRLGVNAADAVRMVESGEMDAAITPPFRSLLSPVGELAREWGPGSENAANGDQRWFGGPRFGLDFVAINPDSDLFADIDVREAVSLSLDRVALAAAYDNAPAAGLLPPSVPGSSPIDAAVPEPDVDAARALMAGRTGRAVLVAFEECADCIAWANTVAGNLAAIGIEVEVRPGDPYEAIGDPENDIGLFNGFLDTDFPDPAALLGSIRELPWVSDEILAELDRVEGLSGQERIDAAAALARRLSEEEFLAIPTAYPVFPMFVGESIGCAFVQPAIGAVDLAALCRD